MAELEQQFIKERQFFHERLVYDSKCDVIHIRLAGDYEVYLGDITRPMHLLSWVTHLAEKTWMNATFIGEFVKKVCLIKGWDLYHG
jgi:hypothetical protein